VSRLNQTSICLLIICSAIFADHSTVLAIPALPSSFYGTVKLNNTNVPDGTVVQAFHGELMIAQGYTQTYQGDSVYSLSVPGDNTDTVVIDGGREGDTITFKVGGILANVTGTWHSATNVPLNLTVTSASTPWAPQATPTEPPTQTPIAIIQPATQTPMPILLVSPTAIIPSLDTKTPDVLTSTPQQSIQQVPVSDDQATDIKIALGKTIPIMILFVIMIIGAGVLAWIRSRN
jgi:hypothetical protein